MDKVISIESAFNEHLDKTATEIVNVMFLPPPYVSAINGGNTNEVAFNSAITLASATSGVVFVPPGNFGISGTINISTTMPVKFIGAGRKLTTINDTRSNGTTSILITTEGCYLSDFTLIGNINQKYGIDISYVYGIGTIIERIVVGYAYGTIYASGFGNATNDGAGLCISTSRYVTIRDCVFGDNYYGIKLIGTTVQQPNVCAIYSSNVEHNRHSGIYCNGIDTAPTVFGGTLQYNSLYGVYSVVTNQQIKLHEVYLEANGFYLENGYNAILHFSHIGHAIGKGIMHIVKNVQDVSVQGIRNTPQTVYAGAEGIYFDPRCTNVRFEGLETIKQNMLTNGEFENTPITTGWSSSRVTIATELSDIKQGTQAIKLTANDPTGSGTSNYHQRITNYANYAGKQVTVGAWVKAPSTNNNTQFIQIWSKFRVLTQLQIPKDGNWNYLTVSHTVDSTPTALIVYFFVKDSNTVDIDDVLFIDDVVLGVGKNCFTRFPVRSTYLHDLTSLKI